MDNTTPKRSYLIVKRMLGILLSLFGILFCLAFFWWWVFPANLILTKGHPFFRQRRLGYKKRVFTLTKFRSMRLDANPDLPPSSTTEEERERMETKFGRFLRKTSIDETPQLFAILLGRMAFIGPRPGAEKNEEELIKERESYTPNAYDVRPGLSGLAQIKMGCAHDIKEKARYDHEYVCKISFSLDAWLFVVTFLWAVKGGSLRSNRKDKQPSKDNLADTTSSNKKEDR